MELKGILGLRYFLPGFSLLLLFNFFLFSATQYHPKLKWKEIQTENFIIYFHQGEENHAQYLANLSERLHQKLTSYFPWKPKGKTRIILLDSLDISNGYSTPIPYNLIGIYLCPPAGYSQIGCWDEWLNFVLTHEYVHTIQLDACGKTGNFLRKISGRSPTFLHFPNLYIPIWTIEGFAVMGETFWTAGGRGRSPDFDMYLRADAKEGAFQRIDRASTYPDSWPGGNTPYLYGGKFIIYLKEKYGDEKLKRTFSLLSSNLIPYTSDWIFEEVYSKPFKKLWNEWLEDYRKETEKLEREREPLIFVNVLKEIGYELQSLIYSMDGRKIFFVSKNPHEFPKIKSLEPETGKMEEITDCYYGNKITLSKDGNFLIFDQLDYYQSFFLFSDLYKYDIKEKKLIRITKGKRLKEPEFDPSTGKIIAIKYELKNTELVEIDIEGREIKKIFSQDDLLLSSPSISHDGKLIALSANRNGNWDILIVSREGKIEKWLTNDKFRDITPSFSKSGRHLVFSSDRNGFFNLYLYDFHEEKLYKLTNLITGAFYPSFSKEEEEIAFLEYYSKGYRISKIKLNPDNFKLIEFSEPSPQNFSPPPKKEYPVKPYNPLPLLKPSYWLPGIRDGGKETQFGIYLTGKDPLEKHMYFLDLYHGFESHRWSGSFTYIYDALYPTISLNYTLTNDLLSYNHEKYNLKNQKFSLTAIFPFYRVKESSFFITELRKEKRKYDFEKESQSFNFSGIRFGILFNNSKKYPFSISRTEGRMLSLLLERDLKYLGSDFNIWRFISEWKEFIKLPLRHHVLGWRLIYGKSWGERRKIFSLGGHDGNSGFAGFDLDNFSLLRGYEKDSFYGTEAFVMNLEYRFPIKNIERGYGNFPLFLKRIHIAPFLDIGNAWVKSFSISDLKKGIGFELRGDFNFSYYFPITISAGFAYGMDKGGKNIIFLRLSNSF